MSASRWGISGGGKTSLLAGLLDGYSTVGFTWLLPSGVLGATSTWSRMGTRRTRVCRRSQGVRRCRTVRRSVRIIAEKDLLLNASVNWTPGPAYPAANEFDLESTLVHEFGHMASGRNVHAYGCDNTPMIVSAGPGEWWRSPTDWFRDGCAQRASEKSSATPRPSRMRFLHLTHDVAPDWAPPR